MMQRVRDDARQLSAARKQRAEEVAEMFLRESEQEIGEFTQRGEQVPLELSNRHAWRSKNLTRLREMSFAEWVLEEEREEEREAESYLDAIEEEER
jgi:hypothetical protein